jgi:hypothetical protein
MNGGRGWVWALTATVLVGASPVVASAQVCIGFPTAAGQGAVAATVGFPSGATDFGVEVGYHLQWGVAAFGGASVSSVTRGDNVTSFGGGAAFAIPELRAALPVGLFSCPVISFNVATGAGLDENVVTLPIGLGLGTILPLGASLTLSPYIVPQLRWTLAGGDTGPDWIATGGAVLMGFLGPRIYAGATVNRIFIEGARSVLGVKAGITF